jgi:hypothetical protein
MSTDLDYGISNANVHSALKAAACVRQTDIKKAFPLAGKGSISFKIISFIIGPFFNLTGLN